MLLKSLIRTLTTLLAATGLLAVGLVAAPAHAAPPACGSGARVIAVDQFNELLEGPLWAPLDQELLARQDRNRDGMLCVRLVRLPSNPPGIPIPPGETNVLVLTVDNPGGRPS